MGKILLQIQYEGFGGGTAGSMDPKVTYFVIGGIAAIVVIIALISRARKGGGKGKGGKFKKGPFKKEARKIGCTDTQINLLLHLIKENDVQNPFRLLNNSSQLDALLHDTLLKIEESDKPENEKEGQKLTIYRIKQLIERNAKGKKNLSNTRNIRHGQNLVLIIEGTRYRSTLVKNLKDSLHVQAPITKGGKTIIVKRWTKLGVQFWKNEGEMYTFQTKVIGVKTAGGITVLMLQHGKDIEVSQQRRFRRKPFTRSAYFGLVSVVTTGRGKKQKKQAVVAGRKNILGNLIDISSGGCSLKTNFPLKKGELIRLQFELERGKPVIAFGKVVATHKERYSGTVMHIQFTRVTRKNINEINAIIYNHVSGREST
jgi:hypothetical protein